jgi:hypothetical protein
LVGIPQPDDGRETKLGGLMNKSAVVSQLAALALISFSGYAPAQVEAQQAEPPPVQVEDVEELNDNIGRFANARVSVRGEIEDRVAPQIILLESGFLFDDEIAVVIPQDVDQELLTEGNDVLVTGRVVVTPIVEIEQEYGWGFDPEIEIELEGTRHYLIAERIEAAQ